MGPASFRLTIANSVHGHQFLAPGGSCTPPHRSPTRLVPEVFPLLAMTSRLMLALYFVYKQFSGFALEVQSQAPSAVLWRESAVSWGELRWHKACSCAWPADGETEPTAACDPSCDTLVVPISYDNENRLGELKCQHLGRAFLA